MTATPGSPGEEYLKIHLEKSSLASSYRTKNAHGYYVSLRLNTPGLRPARQYSKTQEISPGNIIVWNEDVYMCYSVSSSLRLRLYEAHTIDWFKKPVCEATMPVSELLDQSQVELPMKGVRGGAAHTLTLTAVKLQDGGREVVAKAKTLAAETPLTDLGVWGGLIEKVERVAKLIDAAAKVNPYASIAWKVFSAGYELVKSQQKRDESVVKLIGALDSAYDTVLSTDTLARPPDVQRKYIEALTSQAVRCGHFIVDYMKKGFWNRVVDSALSSAVDQQIEHFCAQLRTLQDSIATQGQIVIQRQVRVILESSQRIEDLATLTHMPFTKEANLLGRKKCLPGTRTEMISRILDWFHLSGPETPRILLLTGVAGVGKSSVATTIARDLYDMSRLAASYRFDQNNTVEHSPGRLFVTIARQLADNNASFRHALVESGAMAMFGAEELDDQFVACLKTPLQTLENGILGPLAIVVDALDESASRLHRRKLLNVLAQRFVELPPNFFLIITSRPEHDIVTTFERSPHVLRLELETSGAQNIENDLRAFVASRLIGDAEVPLHVFTAKHHTELARKAEGLFQWADVACSSIVKGRNPDIQSTNDEMLEIYESYVSLKSGALYDLYIKVLSRVLPEPSPKDALLSRLLGFIVTSHEPLSMSSLFELLKVPIQDRAQCQIMLQGLASLLTGVNSLTEPIRTLHSSFRDFVLHVPSGERFHVDLESLHLGVVHGCLCTLNDKLEFNMCKLESSYDANKDVPDLALRIEKHVPKVLSYAARSWGSHLQLAGETLSEDIEHALFVLLDEKFLFWLELLSVLDAANTASVALGHAHRLVLDLELRLIARDCQRFVRAFGSVISRSAPHVYLSAYALAPEDSLVRSRSYSSQVHNLPRLSGLSRQWPALENVLVGHTTTIQSVAFSPDGRRIVSGSYDQTVRIWDAETGEWLLTFEGCTSYAPSVSFSPDGLCVASGLGDGTIRVWNSMTGEVVVEIPGAHQSRILCVAFLSNGRLVASVAEDGYVRFWNAETGEELYQPPETHASTATAVAFSSDGRRIASGDDDGTVQIWDFMTRQVVWGPLGGHTSCINSIAFAPDGHSIASGSYDKTIRIWDAKTGRLACQPLQGHPNSVESVTFSPDSSRVVSGSSDGTIRIWDVQTGALICRPLVGHVDDVYSVVFSPDGHRIASGGKDKKLNIWYADSDTTLGSIFEGHTDNVNSVSFSPDGRYIASGSEDRTVRFWNAETGELLCEPFRGHTYTVNSVSFLPDSHLVFSSSIDKMFIVDVNTGQAVDEPFYGENFFMCCASLSASGEHVVSGSLDGMVRIWDVESRRVIQSYEAHSSFVTAIAYSHDGRCFVSAGSDNKMHIWEVEAGGAAFKDLVGHSDFVRAVAFSPNDRYIASGSDDRTLRLWDTETGQPVHTPLKGHMSTVRSVAFSRNGVFILSGSKDQTIRVWVTKTGDVVHKLFEGHSHSISSLAFSPDGSRIVSGSIDHTIRLWDATMETRLKPFHADIVRRWDTGDRTTLESFLLNGSLRFTLERSISLVFSNYQCTQHMCPRPVTGSVDFISLYLAADGWLQDNSYEPVRLILWIPPEARKGVYALPTLSLVAPFSTHLLTLDSYAHGVNWTNCFKNDQPVD